MTQPPDDLRQLLIRVARTVGGAQTQLADGVARVVRDAPDDRLEQFMRSPARRVVLDGIFWQMPRFLDRRQLPRAETSVRWCITGRSDGGADTYHLAFAGGGCRVVRGDTELDPRLTITVDGAEFIRIATGNSDALQSYFTGRLALKGDIMFAAKLTSLFRVPRPRTRPPE